MSHFKKINITGSNDVIYYHFIPRLVSANSPAIIDFALKVNMPHNQLLKEIFLYDNLECFEALYNKWRKDNANINFSDILQEAISSQAVKCVEFIAKSFQIHLNDIEVEIKKATQDSNSGIVLALCKNDFKQAAKHNSQICAIKSIRG